VLAGPLTTIGRAKDNHLVLTDPHASRRHAQIRADEGGHVIESLGGRNPVLVNGVPVERAQLRDGDCIRVGKTDLRFRVDGAEERPAVGPTLPECVTIDARNRNLLLTGVDEHDLRSLQRAKNDLTALYRAGQVLNASLSMSDLCGKTLGVVIEHIPSVDCCSLHLLDEAGDLSCGATRFRAEEPSGLPRTFSRTITNSVLAERKAILTFDALDDDRFSATHSIASLQMRSAMCVPLQVQTRLTGVIQAHTLQSGRPFTVDDLKLLTALGMMAGAAIENAVLYERMDAERARQEERARLMQVMLHELKSPIAATRMMSETVRMGVLDETKRGDFLQRIVGRLDSMLEWIRDALTLSKLKSGELLDAGEQIDLGALAREIADEYREAAEAKGLALTVETSGEPLPIALTRTGGRLILSNLVSNAVKYTTAGSVRLVIERESDAVTLKVTDTGIGIPEEDIPKMFGEFFRASNARATDIEGSGVGLASVKYIVEQSGGTLHLDSREGAGSTFTISLPLVPRARQHLTI